MMASSRPIEASGHVRVHGVGKPVEEVVRTSLLDDLEAKLRKQEETATRLAESLAAVVAM